MKVLVSAVLGVLAMCVRFWCPRLWTDFFQLPFVLLITPFLALAWGVPARAQVDVLPPVLQQISINSTDLVAGDQVRIAYQATDASGVSFVSASYQADWGGFYSIIDRDSQAGELVLEVSPTMPDGVYRLDSIILYDTVEPRNFILYRADGTTYSESVGAPVGHTFDFAALNFTINGNGAGDVLPPVLENLSIDSTDLVAGDQVRLNYQATDISGLSFVSASYQAESGAFYSIIDGDGHAGELVLDLLPGMPNGVYRLDNIILYDAVDPRNYILYRADGTTYSESVGAPVGHAFDFAALNFTVSGNEAGDVLPPVLEQIVIDATDLVAGDQVRITYQATDASGLSFVSASYQAQTGGFYSIIDRGDSGGELVLDVRTTMPDGVYRLDSIILYDTAEPRNFILYRADGTTYSESVGAPVGHAFDFAALNFTITGNEFRTGAEEAPADPETPVEVEVTPVDEMDDPASLARPDNAATREIFVTTTLGTLSAGAQTGARVLAQSVGGGRYVAYLRSGQAGQATLTAEVDGRVLPSLRLSFVATTLPTTTTFSGPSTGRVGQTLIFSAQVAVAGQTSTVPAGSVSFRRSGTEVASALLDASGTASVALNDFLTGIHQMMAVYTGSTGFQPSDSAPWAVTVTAGPAVAFLGGGVLFAMTEPCTTQGWNASLNPVRVRYAPSEFNGFPSQVSVTLPEGAEHLSLWGPLVSSTAFGGGAGRQTWSRFLFYPQTPLIRVVQRAVTLPPGGTILHAEELVLRLRVQNFGAISGCSATLTATLRRDG
jgi:hypothetical protein